jgi:D-alanyl-D-alanine carboxypeptidase (penicillin-binding protein 5/6)
MNAPFSRGPAASPPVSTSLQPRRSTNHHPTPRSPAGRLGTARLAVPLAVLLALALVLGLAAYRLTASRAELGARPPAGGTPSANQPWPAQGQAAYLLTGGTVLASPAQTPVPIASVAKVMTARLVLDAFPLRAVGPDGPTTQDGDGDGDGPVLTVTADDVADTAERARQDQSVVAVAEGEQLSERQALQALLLPSANNVAVMLARFTAGSVEAFVAEMNEQARDLGLTQTHYTDPSGLDPSTVSTARDQVVLLKDAMADDVFAEILAQSTADLPVVGRVRTTNALLGRDGVIGGKTGSDDDAGGCFAFQAQRTVAGKPTTVTAVLLGQRGGGLIAAALRSSRQLLDQLDQP